MSSDAACEGFGANTAWKGLQNELSKVFAYPRVTEKGVAVVVEAGTIYCSRCGAGNRRPMRFCTQCGQQLGSEGAASEPRPMVAQLRASSMAGQPEAHGVDSKMIPLAEGDPEGTDVSAPGGQTRLQAAVQARLVVILQDGTEGEVYPIGMGQNDIGSRDCGVIIENDPYLAPRHARIEGRPGDYVLQPLDPTNGIYLRMRAPVQLADGDMILAGQQVLRFEILAEAERQLGPALQHGVMVFGTPEVRSMARLVQYTNAGVGRDVHYMYREHAVVGREQADIVFTDDPYMSRRHAHIMQEGPQPRFVLRDLGSSNGTFVRLRKEHLLRNGDQFRLGRHLFRFDAPDAAQGGSLSR